MEGLFKEGDTLVTDRYAFDVFVGSNLKQVNVERILIKRYFF